GREHEGAPGRAARLSRSAYALADAGARQGPGAPRDHRVQVGRAPAPLLLDRDHIRHAPGRHAPGAADRVLLRRRRRHAGHAREPCRSGLLDGAGVTAKAAAKRGFPNRVVDAVDEGKILGIRAGTAPHRTIGIWAVVVEGRVFVRSWSLKPRSWWRTFLEEPRGIIEIGGRKIEVRAVQTRSERL